MKKVIIQGSSRSNGNTNQIAQLIRKEPEWDLIDLKNYQIGQFDYDFKNRYDDFFPLIRKITDYDLILFLTPVYWYSMSGLMKTFFDRITDCLKIEKETGRRLRGKCMTVISCGSEKKTTDGFFVPFELSAQYLGMEYWGDLHTWIEKDKPDEEVIDSVQRFIQRLTNPVKNART
ncbi:NAD(P)H-dependent oxidoreductase [uncultured Croceitalea sp.]|uniref:flavodoxin family protein n=1 Tax=uncultured Croceitalea sp. TaxID=1798908 RepID=UPI0033059D0B